MSTRDLWSTLSTELCLFIIDYLPPKSLLAASQVSCQWRHLCDSIILPQLKLELPRLLRHTSRPTHNISDWSSQDVDNLLKQLPRISATDFFSDIPTFRTLNLALRLLRDAWDGGRPRNVEILNAGGHRLKQRHAYHSRQITSVIIDAENQVIITGDINGLVICWDVKTGEKVQDFVIHEDPLDPSLRAMIGTMALKGNLLAIGCWVRRFDLSVRHSLKEKAHGTGQPLLARQLHFFRRRFSSLQGSYVLFELIDYSVQHIRNLPHSNHPLL